LDRPSVRQSIDLKELDENSSLVGQLAAALGDATPTPWTSPFAASGAKQPPPAPRKPRS
jgi:hypothetical protein